ncbi:hypothetical protein AHAS_Ahas12G0188400 [Arachis hypogaea]
MQGTERDDSNYTPKGIRMEIRDEAITRRLESLWSDKESIDVIHVSNDYYLVKFYAEEDFDHSLMKGPWKIYGHYLTVKFWKPNFNPLNATIDKITALIRLLDLPIKLYDKTMENLIGRIIEVDVNIAGMSREKFARLYVKVDLSKPLLGKYMVNDRMYLVEYEEIH